MLADVAENGREETHGWATKKKGGQRIGLNARHKREVAGTEDTLLDLRIRKSSRWSQTPL